MNTLTVCVFACLAALAAASVGPHGGAIVSGPSGVVTSHGAIGPVGHSGHGVVAHGYIGDGYGFGYGGHGYGHGYGHGAIIAAPVAHAVVAGPAVVPAVYGVGHGYGFGGIGHHGDGVVAVSGHGVTVHGPPTAPAVIAGPSGKVVADGLWGPTDHWAHGHHGW